jgi:hypothetical protein
VRRAYISKVGEPQKLRPLGVLVLEDKIAQRAVAGCLPFSSRILLWVSTGKKSHQALDAL